MLLTVPVWADHFVGNIALVPKRVKQQMLKRSWAPICPVPIHQLAYLTLSYYGMDHKTHVGHLMINRRLATETVNIFHQRITCISRR